MTSENIYKNCIVCALHFLPKDFGPNKVLKREVFPSVNLPESIETVTDDVPSSIIEPEPSTSLAVPQIGTASVTESPRTLKLQESLNAQFIKLRAERAQESCAINEASSSYTVELELKLSTHAVQDSTSVTPADLNATVTPKRKRSDLLAEVNVSRVKDLSPKARRLYQIATQFKRRATQFRRSRQLLLKKYAAEFFKKSELFEKCVSIILYHMCNTC